jgi:hypothetical protein
MPGPKQNNTRRYPDANHQPCHKAAARIGRAEARQEIANARTLEEKIARLPPEPLAQKERARLMAQLEKRTAKPTAALTKGDTEVVVGDTSPKQPKTKKYMRGQ